MGKKKDMDDFEEEFDDSIEDLQEEVEDDECVDIEVEISDISDDVEIIIEVSDEDLDLDIADDEDTEDASEDDPLDDIILSKHQLEGKHSLKYDTIFKGKKDDKNHEEDNTTGYFNEKFEVDKSSFFYTESYDNEYYIRSKNLKEKVYIVLRDHTNINFMNNRRKPSKSDFNNYYHLLTKYLDKEKFTNIELFNELSVYFSDNLFNMFKLLDNKWRNSIIKELEDHIGKTTNSSEIKNRNIYIGTEIEFTHLDEFGELKIYSGVVKEVEYETSSFLIDSYENVYEIDISDIIKILNNTKFKYNLNRLNGIDFL